MDPPPVRTATRITEQGPLVRFSIGLEHVDDLLADLERAFRRPEAEMVGPLTPSIRQGI